MARSRRRVARRGDPPFAYAARKASAPPAEAGDRGEVVVHRRDRRRERRGAVGGHRPEREREGRGAHRGADDARRRRRGRPTRTAPRPSALPVRARRGDRAQDVRAQRLGPRYSSVASRNCGGVARTVATSIDRRYLGLRSGDGAQAPPLRSAPRGGAWDGRSCTSRSAARTAPQAPRSTRRSSTGPPPTAGTRRRSRRTRDAASTATSRPSATSRTPTRSSTSRWTTSTRPSRAPRRSAPRRSPARSHPRRGLCLAPRPPGQHDRRHPACAGLSVSPAACRGLACG